MSNHNKCLKESLRIFLLRTAPRLPETRKTFYEAVCNVTQPDNNESFMTKVDWYGVSGALFAAIGLIPEVALPAAILGSLVGYLGGIKVTMYHTYLC